MKRATRASGQATVEYLVLLSVAIVLTLMVVNQVLKPTFQKLGDQLSARIERDLFSRDGFHRLPFQR